jgi:hypothetical protein
MDPSIDTPSAYSVPTPPRRRTRWKARTLELALALLLTPPAIVIALRRITHESGISVVAADEIGVRIDHWSGARRLVFKPGYQLHVPWLQSVYTLDKSPNALVMKGNAIESPNLVPRLLVRAMDGSSFWFNELVVQYALIADDAAHVLDDSGPGDAFKRELVHVHARAILRDEFGRLSAEDAVQPDNLALATQQSRERLNEALRAHGIEVLEVSTPKPAFDKGYEDHVNRRKVANQEVERLRAELPQLAEERSLRENAARKLKEHELQKLESDLVRDTGLAERDSIRSHSEAEFAYAAKLSEARAYKVEKELQAATLLANCEQNAAAALAHFAKLESSGDLIVRAALVEKLGRIEFTLVPYSRDPAPSRVEHEEETPKATGAPR